MPLKDLKPRGCIAHVEGTKHLSLVKMEFVNDLGLLHGGIDTSPSPAIQEILGHQARGN